MVPQEWYAWLTRSEPASKPYETDPEAIELLWTTSEEATGVKFDI